MLPWIQVRDRQTGETAVITNIAGKCSYEGCRRKATHIACGYGTTYEGRHPTAALYCLTHAELVEDEGEPEYHETCPNCECKFGIG